jgi:hypothetical protein
VKGPWCKRLPHSGKGLAEGWTVTVAAALGSPAVVWSFPTWRGGQGGSGSSRGAHRRVIGFPRTSARSTAGTFSVGPSGRGQFWITDLGQWRGTFTRLGRGGAGAGDLPSPWQVLTACPGRDIGATCHPRASHGWLARAPQDSLPETAPAPPSKIFPKCLAAKPLMDCIARRDTHTCFLADCPPLASPNAAGRRKPPDSPPGPAASASPDCVGGAFHFRVTRRAIFRIGDPTNEGPALGRCRRPAPPVRPCARRRPDGAVTGAVVGRPPSNPDAPIARTCHRSCSCRTRLFPRGVFGKPSSSGCSLCGEDAPGGHTDRAILRGWSTSKIGLCRAHGLP